MRVGAPIRGVVPVLMTAPAMARNAGSARPILSPEAQSLYAMQTIFLTRWFRVGDEAKAKGI